MKPTSEKDDNFCCSDNAPSQQSHFRQTNFWAKTSFRFAFSIELLTPRASHCSQYYASLYVKTKGKGNIRIRGKDCRPLFMSIQIFWRFSVRVSPGVTDVLAIVFDNIPLSLEAISGNVLLLEHDHFLSNPFQFINKCMLISFSTT
jgi:hypothetical protein